MTTNEESARTEREKDYLSIDPFDGDSATGCLATRTGW